jgi:uncharacterized protein (DUF342 family)
MVYANAFFQLVIRDNGTFIKYFPPMMKGRPLDMNELATYLAKTGVPYDAAAVEKQMLSAKAPVLIELSEKKAVPETEKCIVSISKDNMAAFAHFIAPSTGGRALTKSDIQGELDTAGVKFGIDEEAIDKYLANRQYCTEFQLAKGVEPRNGSNASIEYKFNTDLSVKPKENEDGSVDFHSLDIMSKVKAGDVVAVMIPADPGDPGNDVRGNVLKPAQVKKLNFRYGRNLHVSEDGLSLISDVSGHVTLDGDRVSVSDTYTVEGNVDTSTGDINYDGNVEVKGNVIGGFKITASGDVDVEGTVEDAIIEAGGQICLKRGIQGMGKGTLKAGTNIIAKFLESTKAIAGGYIQADAIMNSEVSAGGDIKVDGRKGNITGGTTRSASLVDVKNAGSDMGIKTVFEVGVDPTILSDVKNTQSRMTELAKSMASSKQLIEMFAKKLKRGEKLPPDKLLQFKTLSDGFKKDAAELEGLQNKMGELMEAMDEQQGGCVKVRGVAYPGVKITINDATMYVKTPVQYSSFVKDGADVRVKGL